MLRLILMLALAWLQFRPPSPPYLGPVKWFGKSDNKPIRRLVVHGTVTPCKAGMARAVIAGFKTTSRPSSAHYVVDPAEVLQAVYDSVEAYHAPPNQGSIGVELCDPVAGPLSRWNDKPHRDMLALAARLFAELALAYGIPIRKIGVVGLLAGRRGICGHVNVSKAWHQTDHWDPGAFPWRRFIRMVRAEADKIHAASVQVSPAPAPVKPRHTRVRRARALFGDALDLLAAVPAERKSVHTLHDHIALDVAQLPEE